MPFGQVLRGPLALSLVALSVGSPSPLHTWFPVATQLPPGCQAAAKEKSTCPSASFTAGREGPTPGSNMSAPGSSPTEHNRRPPGCATVVFTAQGMTCVLLGGIDEREGMCAVEGGRMVCAQVDLRRVRRKSCPM